MAHSDKRPLRYRLLVQSHAAYEAGRLRRARELVEQVLARDSNDIEAWYQLGEAHFHDRAWDFPHPDTAGNIGTALNAFRRALSIDSAYVLAYLHIVDALASCGGNNPWLCLQDSAVYAPHETLAATYGDDAVVRLREEARANRLEALNAWVGAAPTSQRARTALLATLIDLERHDEARGQIAIMRAQGRSVVAGAWESRIAMLQNDYAAAARLMRDAVREPTGHRDVAVAQFQGVMFEAFDGGALLNEADEAIEQLIAIVPSDTIEGPGNIAYPKMLLAQFFRLQLAPTVRADAEAIGTSASNWLDTLDAHYQPGTTAHQSRLAQSGSTTLAAYLSARDTTLLSRFLEQIDTTGSISWRAMLAHLALERGDTATARAHLDAHYRNGDAIEFNGAPGSVRLLAWADLLRRLGELREAANALERFDGKSGGQPWPAIHVRAWAERGALYQQLGDTERSIEMYERFVAAWEGGDELVQPLVDRARSAVATLRGEPEPAQPDR
jgi:tetratricopeptide (TPR) repeat protein